MGWYLAAAGIAAVLIIARLLSQASPAVLDTYTREHYIGL